MTASKYGIANTQLPPATDADLANVPGIDRRLTLIDYRLGALNAAINEWRDVARLSDEAALLAEYVAERADLVAYRTVLRQMREEMDAASQMTFHRAFRAVVKRSVSETQFRAWCDEAQWDADAAKRRAGRSLVGSAIPVIGSAGSPRERAS